MLNHVYDIVILFSDFFDCAVGLRQGEVLSPLMFSLFIEDLELFLTDNINSGLTINDITIILLLFADDMVIIGKTPNELQQSLDLLKSYCDTWGLEVNTDKTKIVVFRKRGPVFENEKWLYGNSYIEVVNDFNYLGTCFNYTGTFCLNQEVLTGKGLKALNVFLYKIKNYCISPKILCQLFDAFVGSILSYSCEVWGFNKCKNIEKIHLKFLKLLLGVKKSTSSMAVYGETGRYPLYINRYVRMVKYWGNVLKTDNIIMKTMYNDMLEKQKNGQKNWASQIKNILDMYGLSYVWNNQKIFDFKKTGYLIKNRIIDDFLQK